MRLLCGLILLCAVICLGGCKKSGLASVKEAMKEHNENRIQLLRNCYFLYMEEHGYKGPKDQAALIEFMKESRPTRMLAAWQVTPEMVDQMFIGDRDGEPYVVRWGVNGMGANHAIVFEAKGVDGKRLVALDYAKEMDDAEYEAYFTGKIKPESQGANSGIPTTAKEAGIIE